MTAFTRIRRRRSRLVFTFLAVLIPLVLVLGLIEVVLRITATGAESKPINYMIIDTEGDLHRRSEIEGLVYEMRPNVTSGSLGFPVRTNSMGFRDRDFEIPKPDGIYRIVSLGDSITFGIFAAPEQTYSKILEGLLNAGGSERRYEVVNAGVSGYNAIQLSINYTEKAAKYEPDLLLVGFFPDDLEPPKIPRNMGYFDYLLRSNSYLYRFVSHRIAATRRQSLSGKLGQDFTAEGARQEGRRAIRKLIEQARQRGAKIYYLIHPVLDDSYQTRFSKDLIGLLIPYKVPYLDLFPRYRKSGEDFAALRVEPTDSTHPSVLGHRMIAEWIFKDMSARGMLSGPEETGSADDAPD